MQYTTVKSGYAHPLTRIHVTGTKMTSDYYLVDKRNTKQLVLLPKKKVDTIKKK